MQYICEECSRDLTEPVKLFGENAVIEMHTRAHRRGRIAKAVRKIIADNPEIDDDVVGLIQDACMDACDIPVKLREEGEGGGPVSRVRRMA